MTNACGLYNCKLIFWLINFCRRVVLQLDCLLATPFK